nr:diguanylate cyclase [Candidatus Sulfurimonas ponti]
NDDFHSQHADKLANLTHKANGASKEERDKVREELLKSFMSFFSSRKLHSLEGMHVFDVNGDSLLRFHERDKHDDHIIDLRPSLEHMLKDFTYKKGLEIGVYKESYRFQYPLFHDGEFVGSYEYSISFKALQKEMEKFSPYHYFAIYKAEDIEGVASIKTLQERYEKINVASKVFYIQPSLFHHTDEKKHFDYILTLEKVQKSLASKETEVIDYSFQGKNLDVVIKPILDINKKHIGYILVFVDDVDISELRYEMFMDILLFSLLSLMLLIYVRKQIRHKTYTRELINMQQDMLIVTDGKKLKDANYTMLQFFGFETLQGFESEHKCICDFFIKGNGYLQKDNDGVIWTDYILKYPQKKHQAKIKDISDNKLKIFELEYEVLKESAYLFIVFKDVTDEVEKLNQLMNQAYYDSLTSIYNRSSFEYYLGKELKRASRTGVLFSLIMFDIDHFKLVNDKHGHDVGDSVLIELAHLVSSHIRETDIFARWGGEEFMIISTTNIGMSGVFAEKLRETIQNHEFKYVANITCSFGLTEYILDDSKESIMKRCDNALYDAKETGRNCVSVK